MPTKRSSTKLELVKALLAFYDDPNSTFEDDGRKRSLVDRRQYLNVIFSDLIRPHLAMMGQSLDKDELTAGKKTDQEVHELIVREYDDRDNIEYTRNAFPLLPSVRTNENDKFDNIVWQKSSQILKYLTNEYDRCFHNWKLSGHHGDFPDEPGAVPNSAKQPFEDYILGNKSLLYMHEFIFQFPDILATITGELSRLT